MVVYICIFSMIIIITNICVDGIIVTDLKTIYKPKIELLTNEVAECVQKVFKKAEFDSAILNFQMRCLKEKMLVRLDGLLHYLRFLSLALAIPYQTKHLKIKKMMEHRYSNFKIFNKDGKYYNYFLNKLYVKDVTKAMEAAFSHVFNGNFITYKESSYNYFLSEFFVNWININDPDNNPILDLLHEVQEINKLCSYYKDQYPDFLVELNKYQPQPDIVEEVQRIKHQSKINNAVHHYLLGNKITEIFLVFRDGLQSNLTSLESYPDFSVLQSVYSFKDWEPVVNSVFLSKIRFLPSNFGEYVDAYRKASDLARKVDFAIKEVDFIPEIFIKNLQYEMNLLLKTYHSILQLQGFVRE